MLRDDSKSVHMDQNDSNRPLSPWLVGQVALRHTHIIRAENTLTWAGVWFVRTVTGATPLCVRIGFILTN